MKIFTALACLAVMALASFATSAPPGFPVTNRTSMIAAMKPSPKFAPPVVHLSKRQRRA